MKTYLRIAEYIFTVVSLLFYTGGPLVVILSGGHSEGLSTAPPDFAIVRLCFLLIYIITLCYLAPHWKRAAYLLVKDKWILLLMIIIFFSIFWSVDARQTITRSVAIFGTTLFGIYFATRYSLKQQLYLLGWALGLASVMSVLFAVALPRYGIMQGVHAGDWRGIYTHKNGLGANMALSTITFLVLAVSDKKRTWIFCIGIFLSLLLLLLSTSTSPLVYLMVLTPTFVVARIFRWSYRLKTLAISLVMTLSYVLAIVGVTQAEAIARAFGKDLTLTGRTTLWGYVWELIQKKPWLGYGYGALWSDTRSATGHIWQILGWEAPHAHNGFLEVWLGLGILGLSVLVIHIATRFVRILTLISQTKASVYFFPLMILLLTIINNLTEYTVMERNSIYWILYVSTTLSLQLKSSTEDTSFSSAQYADRKKSALTYHVT
jgi:O-antigen ligase